VLQHCDSEWSVWHCDVLKFSISAVLSLSVMLYLMLGAERPQIGFRHLLPPPV